jgi:hypothetical protein
MRLNKPIVAALTVGAAFTTIEGRVHAKLAIPVCPYSDVYGSSTPDCDTGGYDGGGGWTPPPSPPPPSPTINGLQPGGAFADQPGVCKLPGSVYDAARNLCVAGVAAQGYSYFLAEPAATNTGSHATAIHAQPCEVGATMEYEFVATGEEVCTSTPGAYDEYGYYHDGSDSCSTPGYNRKLCRYPDLTAAPASCPIGTPVYDNGYISACRVLKAPTQGTSTTIFSEMRLSNGDLTYTPNLGSPVLVSGGQTRTAGTLATLYIHGRSAGPQRGWSYWDNFNPGPQPLWVAWNSRERLSQSTQEIDNFLDSACRTSDTGVANTCQVVCHSAGCQMITYRLSQNPGRWNILNVTAVMGTQGGSVIGTISAKIQWLRPLIQLLPFGSTALRLIDESFGLYPIDYDFQPSVARGMYDHNVSGNVPIKTVSADWHLDYHKHCKWYQFLCLAAAAIVDPLVTAANNTVDAIHGGSSDGVVPLASSEGFNTAVNGQSSCRTRWSGYSTLLGGCGLGPNVWHADSKGIREILNGVPATGYTGWK